ncbi:MAG: hypothetical protein LBM96_03120 [Methanobrevibacter sp.]|jgi:hypothetical protein|nr:hypothetical protein [Candidatus Methanoflexus mossambicus]
MYLAEDIRLGWGIGTEDIYYLEVIGDIISRFVKNIKIKNENILFYGYSGGGFTSIQLATMIKGSFSLVNNCQMFVKNYNQGFYEDILRYCFNNLDEDIVLEKYGYRLNVIEMFKKEKYIPPIIYYVNSGSRELINQCIPFIKGLKNLEYNRDNVEIIIYYNERGHSPLNNESSKYLIRSNSEILLDENARFNQVLQLKKLERDNLKLSTILDKKKSNINIQQKKNK